MRAATALASAMLLSCAEGRPEDESRWLGDACGLPDLQFTLFQKRKRIVLQEYQVQGSVMTETGLAPAPTSDRQRQIERALPCLEREAGRRGLTVEYPVVNVDG